MKYDLDDADVNLGSVKVYDERGTATETDWARVFDLDHNFEGDVVFENTLLRLWIDEAVQYGLKVYGYLSAAWVQPLDRLYFVLTTDSKNLEYPFLKSINAVSPDKTEIKIRMRDTATIDEDYYMDLTLILKRGDYHFKISIDKVFPEQDVRTWFLNSTTLRFGFVSDAETNGIGDDDVSITADNTTLSDNFLVSFDDDGTAVLAFMVTDEQPAGGNARFESSDGGDLAIEDIDSTELSITNVYIGLVPFSLITNLYDRAENGVGGGADTVDQGGAVGVVARLNAQNEYTDYTITAGTNLPAGRYIVLFRAYDDNQIASDFQMSVYNTNDSEYRNQENADVHTTLTGSYAFYQLIFDILQEDVEDTDSIRIRALKDTATANVIYVHYFLVVPVGDGESFPKDLAGATLRTFKQIRDINER